MTHKRAQKQRGASFLEFLMIAPVLLLICGSTVELARFIRFRQVADVLSKEAAMRAYRDCDITRVAQTNSGPAVDKDSTQTAVIGCLNNVRDEVQAVFQGAAIQGAIVLSVYRFQPGELVPFRTGDANPLNRPLCSTLSGTEAIQAISTDQSASRYAASGVTITDLKNPGAGNVAPWGCDTGRVFIAEATFNYVPIIGFRVFGIGNSFDVNFANTQLKSTTSRPAYEGFRETTIL